MAGPVKGKQGTKGNKQIVEENVSTLKFYLYMSLGTCALYFLVVIALFNDPFRLLTIIMTIICLIAHIGSYQFMKMMSTPKFSETGAILDSGSDLNMQGAISEHVKDIIILTSGSQLLSLFSNYFWLFLLLAPARAIHMLWGSVIQPWLAQKNEEPQMDEKKQKKMERKMKRMR